MSEDPIRWREDAEAPGGAHALLDALDPAPPLPSDVRERARPASGRWPAWSWVALAAAAAALVGVYVALSARGPQPVATILPEAADARTGTPAPAIAWNDAGADTGADGAAPAASPDERRASRVRALLVAARREANRGARTEALRLCHEALALDPDDVDAQELVERIRAERTARSDSVRRPRPRPESVMRPDPPQQALTNPPGWDEPATTAPSTSAPSRSELPDRLDAAAVRATVAREQRRLRLCYLRETRERDPRPTLRLDVHLRIAPSGRVTQATVRVSEAGWPNLARCVERTVRTWGFPAARNGGDIRFPVVFSGDA